MNKFFWHRKKFFSPETYFTQKNLSPKICFLNKLNFYDKILMEFDTEDPSLVFSAFKTLNCVGTKLCEVSKMLCFKILAWRKDKPCKLRETGKKRKKLKLRWGLAELGKIFKHHEKCPGKKRKLPYFSASLKGGGGNPRMIKDQEISVFFRWRLP